MAGINELGPPHTATSRPSRGSQLLFSSRRCCYRQRGKAVCCLAEQSWKGSCKFLLTCNRAAAEIRPRIAPCFPRAEGLQHPVIPSPCWEQGGGCSEPDPEIRAVPWGPKVAPGSCQHPSEQPATSWGSQRGWKQAHDSVGLIILLGGLAALT